MLIVRLSARCYPTENRDKVENAIKSIFPDSIVEGDDPIHATASSIEVFSELLKRQRIRDAARAVLRRGIINGATIFRLNKQVATVGKVSFSQEGHALGDLEVTFESDDIDALIESVAPDTCRMDAS
ncbi:hypothetical protein A3K69_08795 [Candidatus Bathyarchaeota archaeon RBG_16_57_9]|nr:MAG: hypothetical protein A3K69_08795 [Candidatus Bathyarchaeota archaeon RBG_16_57_9]